MPEHLHADYQDLLREPLLSAVDWHVLRPRRISGGRGYLQRLIAQSPAEVTKYATHENRQQLEKVRRDFFPTVELVVSSWALAAYPNFSLPPAVRLYMVNVDPDIVVYEGPSLKRKIAALIDRPKVASLCRRALGMAARVGSISEADIPPLNALGRRADVLYVPPLMHPQRLDRSRVRPNTVLITTNFTYSQNVSSLQWFMRECWPHVHDEATLTVTGKDEGGRLASLCQTAPRASYLGCLSVSGLDEAFARTAVAVNPTKFGSGFQIKLLDALAHGVPIVSTAFSNTIGAAIPSSDDGRELAELINARLIPRELPTFDYGTFHRNAIDAWDTFLFRD